MRLFLTQIFSKILSRYVGDSPKTIDAIFLLARKMSPSIIFFDEFDAISLNREEKENVGTGLIQKILTEMDGFRKSRDFVMVIASTNRPWALDEAILNRFDYRIYVPLPDFEARKGIFEIELGKKNFEIEADYDDLAKRTEGYSGREISHICRKAIMSMIKRMNPDIENARPGYKLRQVKSLKKNSIKL
jgi:SpoVK/Ycf46/Vps4 family AAA+-type ATPase